VIPVHLPTRASWLNPIKIFSILIFFSILARKALKHFECGSPEERIEHLRRFIVHYNRAPVPFNGNFTKKDSVEKMKRWPDPPSISKTNY
jgi:hypothetical protein